MAAKKYGINEAAKAMGVKPAGARDRFRKSGVSPKGTKYEWDSQKAMQADCDKTERAPAAKSKGSKKKVAAKSKKVAPKRKVKRSGDDAGAEA